MRAHSRATEPAVSGGQQSVKDRPRLFELAFGAAASALMLFLVAPIAGILFNTQAGLFWQTLLDPAVLQSIGLTFSASLIAVGLVCLGGIPLAYLLARREFPARHLVQSLINLPIIIPHTAAGVALLMVFGRRGLFGEALAPLGLAFTDSLAGIVVAMAFVSLPYLVNMSAEAFALVEQELELVALTDGASPWQAFWLVTLPLAWRGVAGGALMMWARGVSEFGAVVILAYHPKIVPVLVYERFEGFGLAAAQPVALILIVVALLVFGLLSFALLPRRSRW